MQPPKAGYLPSRSMNDFLARGKWVARTRLVPPACQIMLQEKNRLRQHQTKGIETTPSGDGRLRHARDHDRDQSDFPNR